MLYWRELQILFRKRIVILREEKPIDTSPVLDLKVFVSAEDFDVPKSFMPILDCTLNWGNGQIAEFQVGGYRFGAFGELTKWLICGPS